MSNLDELQARLSGAMDRIAYGLSQIEPGGAQEIAALQTALAEEKSLSAQLQEQVTALSGQLEEARAASQTRLAELEAKTGALDLDMQKLRQANDGLRAANQALREANQKGVGDPELINSALRAELEALNAARAMERAEADAILAALTPLLTPAEEASNA